MKTRLKLNLGIEMQEKPIQFLPNKMRFVGLTTPGGPNNLSIMAAPIPLPTDTELLIKVHASEIGRAHVRTPVTA